MKKIIFALLGLILICPCFAETRTIKTYSPASDINGYYGKYNGISDYSYTKLAEIENAVFGRNFAGQKILSRIERLEYRVFNRLYPDSSPEQRIANLVHNYNNAVSQSTQPPVTNKLKTVVNDITSSFFGAPTGYTPPISDPYYNRSYNGMGQNYGSYSDYYGNNGWHKYEHNYGTGSGVHIID